MAFWTGLITNAMLEQDEFLHERIKTIMLDVMAVLYDNGIKHVHMGAMMRLLGVPDVKAAEHDDEMLELDEKFGAMLSQLNKNAAPVEVPEGATFH
jgi:hypothetical protein